MTDVVRDGISVGCELGQGRMMFNGWKTNAEIIGGRIREGGVGSKKTMTEK